LKTVPINTSIDADELNPEPVKTSLETNALNPPIP